MRASSSRRGRRRSRPPKCDRTKLRLSDATARRILAPVRSCLRPKEADRDEGRALTREQLAAFLDSCIPSIEDVPPTRYEEL